MAGDGHPGWAAVVAGRCAEWQPGQALIRALAEQVCACLVPAPVPVAFDGLSAYIKAFQRAFRERVPGRGRGRPRLVAWPDVVLVQVIKRYGKGRVSQVEQRIVQGSPTLLARLLWESQGGIPPKRRRCKPKALLAAVPSATTI